MKLFNDLQTQKVSKGTILLYKGDICKSVYRVVKGCLKSYVVDKSGKEHILHFAAEDWLITDMDSFINSKPSNIFINAIEDSEVSLITTSDYNNISQLSHDDLLEQNNKLINNLISTNKRLMNLLSATAEERYRDFIETYPTLVQRLPLKLIASYLGMTPEYLSDVRRKLVQK
ncbi:Crp/Fnr family transcriptional regulator [Maribacter algicola]|uniref:Crp/Fnr family transcriptional regulator n=1 Tax=Maribacter algicola TaxID=2498892 RepID=A0A426RN81_9FLAO|nr:Crp/Fnr family transcriptional regulator [Maribacter algicola]RRQ50471.1 Crp/Fnr family transcriptional regulator [Maribacter algicola]